MEQEHKDFLDNLKKNSKTNMFGAGAYLQEEFDLSKQEARAILSEWMASFKD